VQRASHPWGEPVWSHPVPVTPSPLPDGWHVDVAVVGAGFTGLATAHFVLQRSPALRLAVFEAQHVGAGASGRTGGLVLEDTAVGPLAGVEDCIATLQELVTTQHIACDLQVDGCWEIGRYGGLPRSPIQWADHGTLEVVHVIPGGAFDPRKFLAGLATIIQRAGGHIFEHVPVPDWSWGRAAVYGWRLEGKPFTLSGWYLPRMPSVCRCLACRIGRRACIRLP
jgi:hypothetical protein